MDYRIHLTTASLGAHAFAVKEVQNLARPPRWFTAILAIQVLIPLVVLFANPVPSRFGFHMYTRGEQIRIIA